MWIIGPWELRYLQSYFKKKFHEENKDCVATTWSPGQDDGLRFLCPEHCNKKWVFMCPGPFRLDSERSQFGPSGVFIYMISLPLPGIGAPWRQDPWGQSL